MSAWMAPFLAVLRVVKVSPQVQVTSVTTYSGWIPGFTVCTPALVGRRVAGRLMPLRREPVPRCLWLLVCQTLQHAEGPGDSRPLLTRRATPGAPRASPARRGYAYGAPRLASELLADRGLLDVQQELRVALGFPHPLHQDLERLLRLQRVQHAAQLPDDLQLLRRHQDLLLAGAGGIHVDGGEDPLVGELAAQPQLHVAGALELLEDDLVRAGPGLDEGRGQDGQRAAVLDVPGGAEEPLRRGQGGGGHTTGHD